MVLMTLFPRRCCRRLRPVAAQDYFFRHRLLKWFALRIIGIIPLDRQAQEDRADIRWHRSASRSSGTTS